MVSGNLLHHWFAHPYAFALLTLLPALGLAAFLAARRRRRILSRLGSLPALKTLSLWRGSLGLLRYSNYVSGLILLIVGIAGPQWGRDWDQSAAPGRDLVVVLDLSRSMLAQDVLPNRAERAKQALEDLSHTVQQRGGHRLGLVAFAARARVVCPLTHDYDHFREALAKLDPVHLHPDLRPPSKESPAGSGRQLGCLSTPRGGNASRQHLSGTSIGAGLCAAVQTHDPRFRGYQDILLISDGDDPAKDDEWREGAEEARLHKIPVHTVGVGNPEAGSPIPAKGDEVLRYRNQVVMTRLEEKPLEDIARWTGGTYTPARTRTLPLGELFHERIEPGGVREESDDELPVYRQHYSWFFATAFLFLVSEMILGRLRERGKRNKEKGSEVNRANRVLAVSSYALVLLPFALFLGMGAGPPSEPDDCIRQGNAAFDRGDYAAAVDLYAQAEDRARDPGLVAFNEATALYHLGRYREAELRYRRCREDADGPRLTRLLYSLGNCILQQARDSDAPRLREAIKSYEQCLRSGGAEPEVFADARHNLELARLLWLKAKDKKPGQDQPNPEQESENPQLRSDLGNNSRRGVNDFGPATPDGHGQENPTARPLADQKTAGQTDQQQAGKGNLPPIPDEDDLISLSPEDAAEYLKKEAARIKRERREYGQRPAPALPANVRDW